MPQVQPSVRGDRKLRAQASDLTALPIDCGEIQAEAARRAVARGQERTEAAQVVQQLRRGRKLGPVEHEVEARGGAEREGEDTTQAAASERQVQIVESQRARRQGELGLQIEPRQRLLDAHRAREPRLAAGRSGTPSAAGQPAASPRPRAADCPAAPPLPGSRAGRSRWRPSGPWAHRASMARPSAPTGAARPRRRPCPRFEIRRHLRASPRDPWPRSSAAMPCRRPAAGSRAPSMMSTLRMPARSPLSSARMISRDGIAGDPASASRGRTSCSRRGSTRPASSASGAISTSIRSASNRVPAAVAVRSPRTTRSMLTLGSGSSSRRTAPWNSSSLPPARAQQPDELGPQRLRVDQPGPGHHEGDDAGDQEAR